MARQSRPKPSDIASVCYGINPQKHEVDSVWVRRDGSYSIGAHSYSNQHANPIEAELLIIHGLTDVVCFPIWLHNDENTKAMVAELMQKAAALKEKK